MLTLKKQKVLILAVSAVLIGLFTVGRFLPLRNKAAAARREQMARKSVVGKAQVEQNKMVKLQCQFDEFTGEFIDYEKTIPGDTRLGVFIGRIAGLMNEHKLSQQQITPSKEIEAGELTCIPVSMKCTGQLGQIRSFCKALNELDRAVRVEKFRLTNDNEFNGEVKMETNAVIYYRRADNQG